MSKARCKKTGEEIFCFSDSLGKPFFCCAYCHGAMSCGGE